MGSLHVAGVMRLDIFSPNNIGRDGAIFKATVDALEDLGCRVSVYTEIDFQQSDIKADIVFSMGRQDKTISKLLDLESKGVRVVNAPSGVENCVREQMTKVLLNAKVPHPKSIITATNIGNNFFEKYDLGFPCWIKRAESHAIEKDDVAFVSNPAELQRKMTDFRNRGIGKAVINEHLKGDLVKFYGVLGTPFFFWFYPTDINHSKFGLETINGESQGYAFDEKTLKEICDRAASELSISIYGGDCVVDDSGEMKIIDFNDWPSFAPCREEAAIHIASCIYNQLLNNIGKGNDRKSNL